MKGEFIIVPKRGHHNATAKQPKHPDHRHDGKTDVQDESFRLTFLIERAKLSKKHNDQ
jgi:hypothetical protein